MTTPKVTKVTIHHNSSLDSVYRQYKGYLHARYHNHPTMLDYGPLTEDEKAEQSHLDGYGHGGASGGNVGHDVY